MSRVEQTEASQINARITTWLEEHISVVSKLGYGSLDAIRQYASKVADTIGSGHTVFFCGNGGSAAESQHMAAELVGRFFAERDGYPAVALTVDTSILTAIANDFGYHRVFERQIEALGRPGDLLVAFSTSGNSDNVLRAIHKAKENGVHTVGLTGKDGGELRRQKRVGSILYHLGASNIGNHEGRVNPVVQRLYGIHGITIGSSDYNSVWMEPVMETCGS